MGGDAKGAAGAAVAEGPPGGASRLGRLPALGVSEPWPAALLLPHGWDDLRSPVSRFDGDALADKAATLVRGLLDGEPVARFDGTPRLVGFLADGAGERIGFTAFGDARSFRARLPRSGEEVLMTGTAALFGGWWYLRNVAVVPPEWVVRLRPRYPGKASAISPETARGRTVNILPGAIPAAAAHLEGRLRPLAGAVGLPYLARLPHLTLERIIEAAHLPPDADEGRAAQEGLERLAALGAIGKALTNLPPAREVDWASPSGWGGRAAALPFRLTGEQASAVEEIVADMAGGRGMRRLLLGDVGTGKTAVYGLAAAAAVDGGARVAILLPGTALARQVLDDLAGWWPDLVPRMRLVLGDEARHDVTGVPLVVGTSELLSRGGHLLEVSATCLPRTQALARYGALAVSRLSECHVRKEIRTRLWEADGRAELFAGVRETVAAGGTVLAVYPRRQAPKESGEQADGDDMPDAEQAFRQWNRLFPGRVRTHESRYEAPLARSAPQAASQRSMRSRRRYQPPIAGRNQGFPR